MGPWGEMVKQGFQNFRNGLNTLSYGLGNAGSIYGGTNAGFQPSQNQQQPLQTNNNLGLSQLSQNNNSYQPSPFSTEIQKQAPSATSLYDYLIR